MGDQVLRKITEKQKGNNDRGQQGSMATTMKPNQAEQTHKVKGDEGMDAGWKRNEEKGLRTKRGGERPVGGTIGQRRNGSETDNSGGIAIVNGAGHPHNSTPTTKKRTDQQSILLLPHQLPRQRGRKVIKNVYLAQS